MDQQLKSNLTSSKHWFRLLFMLFFALCLQVAFIVMTAVVCVQFLFALITGEDNLHLRAFGDSLSQFIYQSFQFLTYNSDEKPFPFSDWPLSEVEEPEFEEVDDEDIVDVNEEVNADEEDLQKAQIVSKASLDAVEEPSVEESSIEEPSVEESSIEEPSAETSPDRKKEKETETEK